MNRLVVFRPDFCAFEFIGCDNGIHAPTLGFDRAESMTFTAQTAHKGRLSFPKGEGEGEGCSKGITLRDELEPLTLILSPSKGRGDN